MSFIHGLGGVGDEDLYIWLEGASMYSCTLLTPGVLCVPTSYLGFVPALVLRLGILSVRGVNDGGSGARPLCVEPIPAYIRCQGGFSTLESLPRNVIS